MKMTNPTIQTHNFQKFTPSMTQLTSPTNFQYQSNTPVPNLQNSGRMQPLRKLDSSLSSSSISSQNLLSSHKNENYNDKPMHNDFRNDELNQVKIRMDMMMKDLSARPTRTNSKISNEIGFNSNLNTQRFDDFNNRNIQVPKQLNTNNQPIYMTESGFYIHWDFISGIPKMSKKCHLEYGLYERGELRLEPRFVPSNSLIAHTKKVPHVIAQFGSEHDIRRVPPYPSIFLIMEVKYSSTEVDFSSLGWSILDIFTLQRKLNEGV